MASETSAPKALPPPPSSPAKIVGLLAIFVYFLSLPILGFGIWLLATREYECENLLQMPAMRIGIGVGLLFLFVISNLVVYHGRGVLIPGHTILSIALVVMLMVGLSLVGMYRMEARGVPASPMWLRERVARGDTWNNIKTCLYDNSVCAELTYKTIQLTSYEFSMKKLSAIESGVLEDHNIQMEEDRYVSHCNVSVTSGSSFPTLYSHDDCREEQVACSLEA
uniref:Tetraspanin-15 n=1 Tax=Elaeis guineensis var. tenera TaxID=51953 RepID=A0A6I9QWC6_ELAGV|nr:tetraspanin-15 [Elaeis guineensis]